MMPRGRSVHPLGSLKSSQQQLEDDIRSLEASHRRSGSLMRRQQINTLRKQLRALDGDRAEYALLWTKQRYYAGGDRAERLLAHRFWVQAEGGVWRSYNCRMAHGLTERTTLSLSLSNSTLICMQRRGSTGEWRAIQPRSPCHDSP
ncbi:hypothetical protein NDU88_006497 [Pleurodeles waltl]|uniref:Uncharacterized protein n=1 Tax=Pleurodeles waltl TaxID=8319 RepID=A0AAV7QKX5_PLEWA|nr:hypothetical protein NDU88_006497 [Pleurodeles waltl]